MNASTKEIFPNIRNFRSATNNDIKQIHCLIKSMTNKDIFGIVDIQQLM